MSEEEFVTAMVSLPDLLGDAVAKLSGDVTSGGAAEKEGGALGRASTRTSVVATSSGGGAGPFEVNVKQMAGPAFQISVAANQTVADMKAAIQQNTQLPPKHQRLVFKGRQLEDELTAEGARIGHGSTINLVLKRVSSSV